MVAEHKLRLDAAPSVSFMKAPRGNNLKEYDGARHVRINDRESEYPMFKNSIRPVHPGEVLMAGYIKPMGVSVRAVAVTLHIPYSCLSAIVKDQRSITADTTLRLERYFGSEAQGWLNLQSAYDLRMAETLAGKMIARQVQPLAENDIRESLLSS